MKNKKPMSEWEYSRQKRSAYKLLKGGFIGQNEYWRMLASLKLQKKGLAPMGTDLTKEAQA